MQCNHKEIKMSYGSIFIGLAAIVFGLLSMKVLADSQSRVF